jgi:N-acetylmuramoyl-L-alanine amidase
MRSIRFIVIHCTAGPPNQSTEEIKRYWKNVLGWEQVGYHVIINADGSYERLAPDSQVTNGVKGHNSYSVHICYKGGKSGDTRTDAQKRTLLELVKEMRAKYHKAVIQGHRDFVGVAKSCPQFDAKREYAGI